MNPVSAGPNKATKRGAKSKNVLDRLIPQVWYWAVRSKVNWTDSDLDVEFVPGSDGLRCDKTNRIRTFEAIRKTGRNPSSGNHHLRNFDLVAVVDAHPDFQGTAKVMHSPFWRLLNVTPQSLEQTTQLVDECLSRLGLVRLQGIEVMLWGWTRRASQLSQERPQGIIGKEMSILEYQLHLAMKNLSLDLDLLSLIGALYREACLSFHPAAAEVYGHYFDSLLKQFCGQAWINKVGCVLEDISRHRILYGEKDYLPNTADVEVRHFLNPAAMTHGIIVNVTDPICGSFT